jgi:hypothetical protein
MTTDRQAADQVQRALAAQHAWQRECRDAWAKARAEGRTHPDHDTLMRLIDSCPHGPKTPKE